MVKPLADILSEIEERNSILGFFGGGTPDGEDPDNPDTSEDTGPSNDDGYDDDEDYQGQAMLNYEEDYGKAEGEDQEFWDKQIEEALRLDIKDIPPSLINDRTSSPLTNENNIAEGKAEDEPFFSGVNPFASFLEALAFGLTWGAFDPQLDQGDMFGVDFSTGKPQPQGTVQLSVPSPAGPLSALGIAQALLPSIEVDVTGKGKTQLVGTPDDKLNQVADVLNTIKGEGQEVVNTVLGTNYGNQVADTTDTPSSLRGQVSDEVTPSINQPSGMLVEIPDTLNPPPSNNNSLNTGLPHEGLGLQEGEGESSFIPTIVNAIVDNAVTPSVDKDAEQITSWSLDPNTWYTSAAQGGAIDAFGPGGLAGMMMPRNIRYNPFTGGTPNVPSPFGGQLVNLAPPRPPQFGGLFEPPRPPMQPPQRPKLDAETYFHTHEGGKVAYPNFPQPFINKEDSPNPFKGGGLKPPLPDARPARPFQPYPQAQADEAIISQMNAVEQQPVPPVSISETTATAMQPEEVQETQATTIEEAPVPREIDIQMPENITATLDFPEQVRGTANYARGGLAGILKALAPMGAGFLAGPLGYIPSMLAGAGTGYALAGNKRSFLDAIKGGLSGYAGSGVGRLGTAVAPEGANMADAKAIAKAMKKSGTGIEGVFDVAQEGSTNYLSKLGDQFSGLGKGLTAFDSDVYKALGSNLIGPATAGIAATAITPPSEMPEFTEVEVEQIKTMTPEQRRAYIENKRRQYSNQTMQPTTFAPPNVGIDFDVTTAADGGVMEIDEEMQSGSFVLPADVVSNVGDGSSTSGHRRLSNLFGMSEEEYAMGGGILKGPIKGPGGGLDDLIQTGIDGVRVARLSTDEFVVPKDVVRRLGEGSQKVGAEKLYDFMKDVRLKKHGTSTQPKEMHMSGLRKMV